MKPNYINFILAFILGGAVILSGCSKVLDKTNLNSFDGELVFNDSLLAENYLNLIYEENSPEWPGDWEEVTDEEAGESRYFEGTVQVNTVSEYGRSLNKNNVWGQLRSINQFLQEVEKGGLSRSWKNILEGQAYFFRAYRYFKLVRLYGGVPLVLKPQDAVGKEAKKEALLPRNTTSECIAQIVSDLDFGITNLPEKWDDDNWGRITSGAAAALKGRVLLWAASPQFNPGDLQDRWQAAYDANKKAKEILEANGFGLNPDFQNMWFEEVGNPEAVWVVGYNNQTADQLKKNDGWDDNTRPSYLGTEGGSNQPTKQIVDAFPMKDGKDIEDPTSTYAYDPQLFYKNRGPRFYATIAYNGCQWYINGNPDYRLWTYYVDDKTIEPEATNTGFYCRKAIDPDLAPEEVQYAGTDWMEIRFAEVVLNLAESACGINKINEAYEGLKAIRKRAGIEPGTDGLYGLKPGMARNEMFKAILHERQIEFAFEGKRFWDLRRWKLFEPILNGTRRTGVRITLNTSAISADDFAAKRNAIDLDSAYLKYFEIMPDTLDTRYSINWQSNYYYFAIPQQAVDNDPKLEQTKGWPGGTFDPLQ